MIIVWLTINASIVRWSSTVTITGGIRSTIIIMIVVGAIGVGTVTSIPQSRTHEKIPHFVDNDPEERMTFTVPNLLAMDWSTCRSLLYRFVRELGNTTRRRYDGIMRGLNNMEANWPSPRDSSSRESKCVCVQLQRWECKGDVSSTLSLSIKISSQACRLAWARATSFWGEDAFQKMYDAVSSGIGKVSMKFTLTHRHSPCNSPKGCRLKVTKGLFPENLPRHQMTTYRTVQRMRATFAT